MSPRLMMKAPGSGGTSTKAPSRCICSPGVLSVLSSVSMPADTSRSSRVFHDRCQRLGKETGVKSTEALAVVRVRPGSKHALRYNKPQLKGVQWQNLLFNLLLSLCG